jgi:hypothetical protein
MFSILEFRISKTFLQFAKHKKLRQNWKFFVLKISYKHDKLRNNLKVITLQTCLT